MKYQRMINEDSLEDEDKGDPISVYIVCDERSECDLGVLSAVCGEIVSMGISVTKSSPRHANESFDGEEKATQIYSATWVIVICSDTEALTGDNMFSYEENLALFQAMNKGLQNIIYLTADADDFPSKGFNHLGMASNTNWPDILRELIQTSPKSIDGKMLTEFCSQVSMTDTNWYATLPDMLRTLSRPSRDNYKIVWVCKCRERQESSRYVFGLCGDYVKLESAGKVLKRSVDVSVSCDLTAVESDDYSLWVKEETKNTGDGCCDCGCCIFANIVLYGYIAMSVFAASPLDDGTGYTEEIRSTYIPGLQVAHMVISLLMSFTGILCSTMERPKEWKVIATYHSVFAAACLILQVLYFVGKLPRLLDVVVGGGVLCFCVYFNNLTVTNYFGAITRNRKCMLILRAIGFLVGVSLFVRFCVFTPQMFMRSTLSFKTTLVILSILFLCEMGFFRVLVRYIYYFVRLKFKKPMGNTAELLLLLVFMSLWFGPSFFFY